VANQRGKFGRVRSTDVARVRFQDALGRAARFLKTGNNQFARPPPFLTREQGLLWSGTFRCEERQANKPTVGRTTSYLANGSKNPPGAARGRWFFDTTQIKSGRDGQTAGFSGITMIGVNGNLALVSKLPAGQEPWACRVPTGVQQECGWKMPQGHVVAPRVPKEILSTDWQSKVCFLTRWGRGSVRWNKYQGGCFFRSGKWSAFGIVTATLVLQGAPRCR